MKQWKKRAFAMLLSAAMVLGTTALAAGAEKVINVTAIGMTINGQSVTPTKSDGAPAEVFAYDGATYVPLRYLSELLGIEVEWDKNDPNTAKLVNVPNVSAPTNRDVTVDFVVVGAGAGGLSASTEAARQGKSVILLEKLAFAGGSSALCEGYFWASDSKLNAETGKGFDTAAMKTALKDAARGKAVDELIDNLCEVSGPVMDSLTDGGVVFLKDKFTGSGGAISDLDVFIAEGAGNGFMQSMLKIAQDNNVDIRYESKATELIYEDGQVKGVKVTDKDGSYNIYASSTVLATGGFLRNEKLMQEYAPDWVGTTLYCGGGSTGDGHEMAMKLGAHMLGSSFGCVWEFEGKNGYHMNGGLTPAVSFFKVNQEGKRVLNEFGGATVNTNNNITVQQTGKKVYCFMDSTSAYAGLAEQSVAEGLAYRADTLEELADIYGIDKAELVKTVKAYNDVKASGKDDPDFGVPNAYMVSMSKGPFYATYYQPMPTNCLAGLEADEYCRILGADNQPIPNLYGVGELIMGSVVGDGNYPTCGTCLAAGIYGGAVAVQHQLGLFQ